MPTLRPAAARRCSWALEREQPSAFITSSALTHPDMPVGSGFVVSAAVSGIVVSPMPAALATSFRFAMADVTRPSRASSRSATASAATTAFSATSTFSTMASRTASDWTLLPGRSSTGFDSGSLTRRAPLRALP